MAFCVEQLKCGGQVPYERQGTVSAFYQGYLYVFGGRSSRALELPEHQGKHRALINQMARIDISKLHTPSEMDPNEVLQWESLDVPDSVISRHNHASVVWQKYWVIFGGVSYNGYLDELLVYDLEELKFITWNIDGITPVARGGHIMEIIDDKVYIHGGSFENDKSNKSIPYLDDLHELNLTDKTWREIEVRSKRKPRKRNWHSSCILEIRGVPSIVIFGGYWWDGKEHYYDDLWFFDIETKCWKEIRCNTKPHRRNRNSLVVFKNHLVIQGGNFYPLPQGGGRFYYDCWCFPIEAIQQKGMRGEWKRMYPVAQKPFFKNSRILFGSQLKMAHFITVNFPNFVVSFGGEVNKKRNNKIKLLYYYF